MKSHINSHSITVYGVYAALFLMMSLVPYLGYISIPPVKATLMAIPVALVTMHKKIKGALFGSFMFGFTSIIAAAVYGSVFVVSPYNWFYGFLLLFGSRILILLPLIPSILLIERLSHKLHFAIRGLIYSLVISVFNTLIFILFLYIIDSGSIKVDNNNHGYWAFIFLIGKNIAVEWTIPPIVATALGSTIYRIKDKENVVNEAKW